MVTATTYIYTHIYTHSSYSCTMEMSRAMLACDGPSSALTQPAETRPGAEVWSEPSLYPFITLEP